MSTGFFHGSGDRRVAELRAPVTAFRPVPLTPSASSEPLLRVANLSRQFGGVHAVVDVSFEVPARGIMGLIGPNGAGKSTLVGVIAGDIRPSTGTVSFLQRNISDLAPHQRARLGLIRTFQLSGEFARLTVLENLLAAVSTSGETVSGAFLRTGQWRRERDAAVERALAILERFEMSAKVDAYAGELSGGEKRLVEIMRGLMANPRLLLLDEPMAGVNPALRGRVESHLLQLRDEGLAMLMIEHELSVVERCCGRVVVMARGRKIAEGTMKDHRADQQVRHAYLA